MMKIFTAFLLFLSTFINAQDFWKPFPINLYEGHISSMVTIPGGEMIAVPPNTGTGIYYSKNDGDSWEKISDFHSDGYIYNTSQGVLFTSLYNIFRSTNKGISWDTLDAQNLKGYRIVTIDLNDNIYIANESGVILKSTDLGNNWNYFSQIYYLNEMLILTNGDIFASDRMGNYILKSTDNGGSWEKVIIGGNTDGRISKIFSKGTILFVATNYEVFKSLDNGNNWQMVKTNNYFYPFIDIDSNSNGDIILLYTNKLFFSTNDGNSWTEINKPAYTEKIFINDKDYLFSLTHRGDGLYRSKLDGEWVKSDSGLQLVTTEKMFIDSSNSYYIITQNSCIYRSDNQGLTWNTVFLKTLEDQIVKIDNIIIGKNCIYSIHENELYKSLDNGNNWSLISVFNDNMTSGSIVIFADSYSDALYAAVNISGTTNFNKYNVEDSTWIPFNTGLSINYLNSIIFLSNGFMATILYGSGVYISKDNQTWDKISNLTDSEIDIIISNSDDVLFAYTKFSNKIYNSIDYGDSWETFSLIGEERPYSHYLTNYNEDILIDGVSRIFQYDTLNGIYITTDAGKSWKQRSEGIPSDHRTIREILVDKNKILYANIDKAGIFSRSDILTNIEQDFITNLNTFSLSQNFPNPFNPVTKIKYAFPDKEGYAHVSLKVYDILGKEIITLVNEEKAAGEYEIDFEAKNLASGIYFYKIQVNDFIESKKMILLK